MVTLRPLTAQKPGMALGTNLLAELHHCYPLLKAGIVHERQTSRQFGHEARLGLDLNVAHQDILVVNL